MSDRTEISPANGRGIEIDPARLAAGEWCHRLNRTIGQGDIYASYSADRIGMGKPISKPFVWRTGLWVCVSMMGSRGNLSAEAYRLTHPAAFDGVPVTYRERTINSAAARTDVKGFYHGMTVSHGGQRFILTGPPVTFIPGQTAQLSLF